MALCLYLTLQLTFIHSFHKHRQHASIPNTYTCSGLTGRDVRCLTTGTGWEGGGGVGGGGGGLGRVNPSKPPRPHKLGVWSFAGGHAVRLKVTGRQQQAKAQMADSMSLI